MDFAEYCRELEAYLCRKNEGHLIRIVGPTFETVRGWAAVGVPFKVACRGIDRCCERRRANGPRRRPVRLEFCEADVLDEFERWRRAVGVSAGSGGPAVADRVEAPGPSRGSLPRHHERVASRLTAISAGRSLTPAFAARIDLALDEIESLRQRARGLRGGGRAAVLARLTALDREMLAAARDELAGERDALADEAAAELEPFRMRMTGQAWVSAVESGIDRLVRERLGLPTIELT